MTPAAMTAATERASAALSWTASATNTARARSAGRPALAVPETRTLARSSEVMPQDAALVPGLGLVAGAAALNGRRNRTSAVTT